MSTDSTDFTLLKAALDLTSSLDSKGRPAKLRGPGLRPHVLSARHTFGPGHVGGPPPCNSSSTSPVQSLRSPKLS